MQGHGRFCTVWVLLMKPLLYCAQDAQCRLRMLRVVNSGDAVPGVPMGPITGGRW